ncbi:hypothetical protein [Neoroseomonas marina]|nr:hypothetical protein [Neoroseomonas marina]
MRIALLLFLALTVSGCCGRGLWYSSPSSRCDLAPPAPSAIG